MAFISGGIVLVAIVLLADPTEAAQLSFGASQTQNQSVVHACVNESVSLPWRVAIPTTDSIVEIKWYFHGNSDELIAIFSGSKFGPLPGFSDGRAEFLANAGLVIHHVTVLDKGNYSVVVDVLDTSGQTTTLRDSVIVQITDNPVPGHTELNITQHAEYSDATEQFHVVLSCGTFLSLAQPPFDVRWETPSGSEVSSSSYTQGQFRLQLPNPVPGGSYTCRVPASAAVCGAQASVHVDRVDARLTMLEAHNQRLMQENLALKNNISQYINASAANQISFHARLDKNLPQVYEGITLKFSAVSLNQGGAYVTQHNTTWYEL
ncbi:uncharacterized protein [Littorina saxatilis]|uniref:uncharacterized protein n=1 Tax=Littorina saxatilis TaxID=31220 RepID=UPI0038B5A9D7